MITTQITLWCDGEGCDEWFMEDTHQRRYARHIAKRDYGWVYSEGRDLCPRCRQIRD